MPDKAEKTNAMRLLDARKVPYIVHHYTYSAKVHSADEVAATLGLPSGQVFKTLVVMPEKGRPFLAIVPGDRELDLKKMAQATHQKKVCMATQREAESLTGLLVGGISALALTNKGFKVFLDASANHYQQILVSAGQRGINLQLAVQDLIVVLSARLADLVRASDGVEG